MFFSVLSIIFIKVRINVKWEQRKLSSIAHQTFGGGTPSKSNKQFWNGDFPWIQSSDLAEDTIRGVHPNKFITQNALLISAAKKIPKNSIAIVSRVGVGKVALIPFNYSTSQDFLSLSGLKINSQFATYSIHKIMKKTASQLQGTSIKGITKKDILNKTIIFPISEKEQVHISSLLKYVDYIISLQQRKLKQLERLKTAMLQQLLANQRFPKVRFNDFKDSWKDYRLGEVFDEFSVKSKRENEYKLLSSTTSGMESRSGRVSGRSNIGYKVIDNGDIVLSPQNLWLGNINLNNMGKGIVSPSYHTFKIVNANPIFVNFQLKTEKMLFEYKMVSVQGASVVRRNLDMDAFKKIVIKIPNEKEQIKIASLFSSISNIINNHQNKLTQLSTLKKYLLQKMFI
ncbi:restriction endonuclease subunit S [Limosilactobacillus reuteri]|uniref:restriction endonuclease subunit S n=1 Tax=Limosilactobacillus reuteri TaxID=1598 RepID=UPI003CFE0C0D